MDKNDRSRSLIRELYQLSEAGAFDHVSESTVDAFCAAVKDFVNPILTYREAAKATGRSLHGIYSKESRSGVHVFERSKGLRWRDVKRIIDKRI